MFDPSQDFAVIDGTEPVTLLRRGRTSGDEGTVIAHALRRAMTAAEAAIANRGDVHKQVASGGAQIAADLTWHLPVVELPESPRLGDVILDGDRQRWTILELKRATLGARWRCTARNVAIASGLDDTITVLKATYVKSPCGAAEPMWRTWKTGVRARIQPQESAVVSDAEARGTVVRCRIYVEEDLELDHTCCFRAADGTVYTIKSVAGAERIGELQTIEAEVAR